MSAAHTFGHTKYVHQKFPWPHVIHDSLALPEFLVHLTVHLFLNYFTLGRVYRQRNFGITGSLANNIYQDCHPTSSVVMSAYTARKTWYAIEQKSHTGHSTLCRDTNKEEKNTFHPSTVLDIPLHTRGQSATIIITTASRWRHFKLHDNVKPYRHTSS